MSGRKAVLLVVGLVAMLSFGAAAQAEWILSYTAVSDGTNAHLSFVNQSGYTANVLHLEFEQEVTITYYIAVGGTLMPLAGATGTTIDLIGELGNYGEIYTIWEPATAYPVYAQWLAGETPVGSPHIGSLPVLGRLFGQGIAAVREANPAALTAAFDQFFADNGEYLAGLSESLGMDLAAQLLPVIMAAPAEGIENFFNTILGMLGATSLEEVVGGGIDFSSLFALLGM